MKYKNIKKEFVDFQVSKFSEQGANQRLLFRHQKIIDLVLRHTTRNNYILDIGCFDGKILKNLEKLGFKNLFGVDFSDVSKQSFKNSTIKFASCDIENEIIPFKEKFDVVIFADVLEHLFSPQTTIFDLKTKLKKKSKIIFSVPNAGWFLNAILLTFLPSKLFLSTAFGPWGHTYHFTFYSAKRLSQNLNFKIIELSGGKIDNYAFPKGIKKFLFEIFSIFSYPLAVIFPQFFSAHIFGVFENLGGTSNKKKRFDIGI